MGWWKKKPKVAFAIAIVASTSSWTPVFEVAALWRSSIPYPKASAVLRSALEPRGASRDAKQASCSLCKLQDLLSSRLFSHWRSDRPRNARVASSNRFLLSRATPGGSEGFGSPSAAATGPSRSDRRDAMSFMTRILCLVPLGALGPPTADGSHARTEMSLYDDATGQFGSVRALVVHTRVCCVSNSRSAVVGRPHVAKSVKNSNILLFLGKRITLAKSAT